MIIDDIANSANYFGLSNKIDIGIKALSKIDFSTQKPGTYQLSNGIYYILSCYLTKDKSLTKLEAHRKFIDIQFMVSGEEKIGYKINSKLIVSENYDESKDVEFFKESGELFTLHSNSFAIFFPQDAHAPQIAVDKPREVIKVVIKVPIY